LSFLATTSGRGETSLLKEVRTMPRVLALAVVVALTVTLAAASAAARPGSLSAEVVPDYRTVRDFVIRAAEKMPEADYGFKPTSEVRSFAQQVAHVADDQYNLCAPALGETRKAAYREIETTLSKKADLVAALRAAFAYCDRAYDSLTDAWGVEPAGGGSGRSRFGMLNWNLWHTWEHYGNMVVYLRLKGLVPPSSEKTPPSR
jgi:uncharacterized damage-inducible protein DinB